MYVRVRKSIAKPAFKFEHTIKLVIASSTDDEVLGVGLVADEVHVAYVGLLGGGVDAGDDGLDEEGAEATLVEQVRQHGCERLGAHLSAFAQLVHVGTKPANNQEV